MAQLYKVDENGFIKEVLRIENPSDEIRAEYLETDKEIVFAPNGRMVFADELNDMDFSPVLEDVKQTKIFELKQERDAEELSPVSYSGYAWDFDDKSQQRINGAIIALANGGSVTWTSADNKEISGVNANDLRGVVGAAAIRSNELHIKYRQLRERVDKAESVEEVEAIVW